MLETLPLHVVEVICGEYLSIVDVVAGTQVWSSSLLSCNFGFLPVERISGLQMLESTYKTA